MGKAVEMISNAIAEMRSYGDGFIIADQSPGLIDTSVLRNTNTKIIMRLPEGSDREIVGNTIGLTSRQAYEISRLKTGTGVIYQKDWLEAVLCQVDRAKHREEIYVKTAEMDSEEQKKSFLVHKLLYPIAQGNHTDGEDANLQELLLHSALPGALRRELAREVSGSKIGWMQRMQIVTKLLPVTLVVPCESEWESLEAWCQEMIDVNGLERYLDRKDAEMVIAAHAWGHAKENVMWRNAASSLFSNNETGRIENIRGHALTLLFGKNRNDINNETVSEIREWALVLTSFGDADSILAGLLEKYVQDGLTRKRGELKPYSMIAWEYAGGNEVWDIAYTFLEKGDVESWDSVIRSEIIHNVVCKHDVQTELISLILQHKGADNQVRHFYYRWITRALEDSNELSDGT